MDADTNTASMRPERVRRHGIDDTLVQRLAVVAEFGLRCMYRADGPGVAYTVRAAPEGLPGLLVQGESLRYAAMVALGVGLLNAGTQRELLGGATAGEFATALTDRGVRSADPGAAALVGWATAEVAGVTDEALRRRLRGDVLGGRPIPTVDFAWVLTALLADHDSDDARTLAEQAAERLLAAQSASGLFSHMLPAEVLARHRAHVGCFADQVYPIIALARYASASGDQRALDAASRCAQQIVAVQGDAGQWWWHYDVRNGRVIEGYPVYSVHQHAMAPMALFELADAGGADHSAAVAAGLRWLIEHPETKEELIDDDLGVIWRKVGRREPRKAVRALRAAATAVSPHMRLGLLDRAFPPGPIDRECRPYEFGWLLYAWRRGMQGTSR